MHLATVANSLSAFVGGFGFPLSYLFRDLGHLERGDACSEIHRFETLSAASSQHSAVSHAILLYRKQSGEGKGTATDGRSPTDTYSIQDSFASFVIVTHQGRKDESYAPHA